MFDNTIKFKYPWRPYQERTLKQVEKYLRDKKVHIVAAPGSGKTVLGLELARYLRNPVIIFAPTVTIKNQWVDRFISLFTDFKEVPDWVSTDIYNLKFFNVVTYQALHYAYKRSKERNTFDDTDDIIEDTDVSNTSLENIKSYDIVAELKKNKITTIILDEAHHLKSQWWESLKKVVTQIDNSKIIALTATPPYDSDASEWKKYVSLCGEIDAEISVPELVKANNLCPHQDYIYFSSPTKDELEKINEYKDSLNSILESIKSNENLVNAVKSHKFFVSPFDYEEELLDNVEYYSSILVFLNYKGIKISKDNLNILGDTSRIPAFNINWFEVLLKNVLISDRESYAEFEDTISQIEKDLTKIGVIEKSSLSFSDNKVLQNYFLNSIGKLNSISEIVQIESESLKSDLRMVILTDYIRKEFMNNTEIEINKLGVFPIFRKLYADFPNLNIAILTGSVFVIPTCKKDLLLKLCTDNNVDVSNLNFDSLVINENYSVVNTPNSIRNKVMSLISQLFSNGEINVIIGTKSLLGEGWDEPSINTLILASFVGSFMLSNQMRGRAIRVNDNPNKTANIWHLVCATDLGNTGDSVANTDFELLKRRFNAFVGLDYNSLSIKNGINRLGNISEPFNEENILKINNKMKVLATNRQQMYDNWKKSINLSSDLSSMHNKIEMDKPPKMKKSWFINKKLVIIAAVFLIILFSAIFKFIKLPFIFKLIEAGLGIYLTIKLFKIFKLSKSENMIKEVGYVVLNSLYRCGFISCPRSKVKLNVRKDEKGKLQCFISGATLKESNLFVDCLDEVFSKSINQRYIISKLSNNLREINEYYNVPTVLSVNKEFAEVFSKYWKQKIGEHVLVYTRTAEGRKLLLKARMKSLSLSERFFKVQEFGCFK